TLSSDSMSRQKRLPLTLAVLTCYHVILPPKPIYPVPARSRISRKTYRRLLRCLLHHLPTVPPFRNCITAFSIVIRRWRKSKTRLPLFRASTKRKTCSHRLHHRMFASL